MDSLMTPRFGARRVSERKLCRALPAESHCAVEKFYDKELQKRTIAAKQIVRSLR
jgi:hypothetical protein